MYLLTLILGCFLCFVGEELYQIIAGGLFALISIVILVRYIILPKEIILVDKNNQLHLPKGISLNPKDIVDVSYRRASARSIQYKWGSVTIETRDSKYKFGYVADCEFVAKNIYDLMYKSKSLVI